MTNEESYKKFLSETTVYINGEHVPPEKATISVFDRGFLYGDSIYEVCYSEDGKLKFYQEHLDRLYHSAHLLNLEILPPRKTITKQVVATLKKSNLLDAYLRIIVTRGESIISLDPNTAFRNNLITIVKPKPIYPSSYYKEGIDLILSKVLRNNPKAVDPNAKSGNYLNNVMAMSEARSIGYTDALMINHLGNITEGTSFNVYIIKDNIITTPPIEAGVLKGITRGKLLLICEQQAITCRETDITLSMLHQADEVFITSSTRKVIPIKKIDETLYTAPGKMTQYLMNLYDELLWSDQDSLSYL